MKETREDKARTTSLTDANLAECSDLADYISRACREGMQHARENGAGTEDLEGAREIRSMLESVIDFLNGGKGYAFGLTKRGERVT